MTKAVVHMCLTCSPETSGRDIATLQAAIDAARLPAEVLGQNCMNACENPVSLALQGDQRATYFFTGIQPAQDHEDIIATLRLYLQSPRGWIEDARPCGRLRLCLTGRVPALNSEA